jgi:hypothetical protein
MHLAEGRGDDKPAELPLASSASPAGSSAPAAASGVPAPAEPPEFTSDPPDPPPVAATEHYEYSFRYDKGTVHLLGVRALRFKKPVMPSRRIGRFALELWIGRELIDRVRFDFPLLGGDEPQTGARPLGEPPSLASGSYDAKVLIPAAPRARSARLFDRKTRDVVELPWPPEPKSATLVPSQPLPTPQRPRTLRKPAAPAHPPTPSAPSK